VAGHTPLTFIIPLKKLSTTPFFGEGFEERTAPKVRALRKGNEGFEERK
jgi:hypothetical protein